MEKELSKTAGDLIDLMKSRGVNQDSCIGTLLTLETEDNYKLMLRWIKRNPRAGQTEILRHLRRSFMEKVSYYVPSVKSRKIAVF